MEDISHNLMFLLAFCIILFVMNRYFSGTRYTAQRPKIQGKIAVLTGGNSGIGKQTAKALAQQGCKVIIGARDTKKSERFVKEINARLGKEMVVHHHLELGDLDSIREFVNKIKEDKIDYLINNAGILSPPKRTMTKSGFEIQYGVNYLGHFYLTHLLWPKLNKSDFFRVINVSSLVHKKVYAFFGILSLNFSDMNFQKQKYIPQVGYSRSKMYNNLFTHALAQLIPSGKGLTISLHPGIVRTEITRYMLEGWKQKGFEIIHPFYSIFTKSPQEGAQTTLMGVLALPQQLVNGSYYSDCRLSQENKEVNQENWKKLWEISQRDLNITFGKA